MICFDINHSKTLDIANKTLIGRKFYFIVVSPVLTTGDSMAFLKLSGKVQFSIIELAIFVTSLKHKADANFKVFAGTLPLTDFVKSN